MKTETLTCPVRTGWKYLVGAGLVLLALWLLADVLLMLFAAILLAIAYRGSADWLARRTPVRVGWALALIGLGLVALLGFALWWGGTNFADEAGQLWNQLQGALGLLHDELQQSPWGRRLTRAFAGERLLSGAANIAGTFAGAAWTTFGIVGSVLIVLVTAVYLALEPELYRDGVLKLLPIPQRQRGAEVMSDIGDTLRAWLLGRGIDMLVVTGLTWLGLMLLGMPLALMLAVVAGLLNFVPYIGAIAGAVPAVLVAFGIGPSQALWVGLLFLVIQTVEGYFLAPLIQRRTTRLPPVVTILSQTVFGTLFGIVGLLVAPALAAAILVIVRMVYVRGVLGDGGDRV